MSQQDHKDFFISYNGADQRWAEWIAWQLEEAAYSIILQAWDFLPGSNFIVQMNRALTLAPRTIAVLSPQYLSALYTQPEWAAAFQRDPKGEQSLLIPVRVQACEVTGLLGPIVYVDLVGQDEATARQRLLAAVRHERAKPAQAPAFPQAMQHTISKQLNFPGDLPPIWKMPHQRDPLFLGREQLLQELHTTLATDHTVLLFEPAREREAGTSGATETAVEYAYRYRSDYQVIAWIQADSHEAFRSDLLSLAASLHLPQGNPSDQDPLTAVVQWLRTHQHWLLVLDQVHEKEVLAPLTPLPEQGHLLVVTSTRSLGSLAPLIELSQAPWEERTVLTQLSQVVGAALQGPQGRVPLGLEPITIGRASTNQVVLRDPSVSSRHAIIALKDRGYWITDTGSTNGTVLNQQRLVPHVPSQLHPGDRIRFGNITYTYEVIDRPSRSPVSSPSSEQGNTSAGTYPPSSPVIERPRQDRVGQRFGNYRLSQLLGQGGFAEVYLGKHIFLDTQTAIKVLYTQLVGQDVEQFRQEARTIAHMEHPHIVRLLDFGVEGTTPYLIMSYAPNGTMRQRYPKGTRLPVEQVVFYVKQIAQALQYAHDHKIIHRDIKPENMLFGSDDQVLLSDFGIALVAQSSRYQHVQDIAGTVTYMAPEQIQAHPRPASDQYSLGIVVYEWLSGDRPFHGSFTELAVKHSVVPPPSLCERVPALLPAVEQVVMIALAKDPSQRFASVQAFATALEQASKSSPDMAVLPSQFPSPNAAMALLNQEPQLPEVATPPSELPQPPKTASPPSQPSLPSSLSPDAAPPVRQTSLPTAQVPPPTGHQFTRASTPLPAPLGSSVTGHSISKIQPRQQRISWVLFSLVILATVVIAGGGIAWLAFLRSGTPVTTSSVSTNGVVGSTIIKIATDLPVSGKDTSYGKPVENGAHLAVDQANANHTIPGYTLQFVSKDDVGSSGVHDPAVGAQNVTSLIGDALVAGIVGPFNSNVAKAEMPITNQAPIALISPSNTNTCLTQEAADVGCSGANVLVPTLRPTGKVTYFRIATTDDHQGPAGADYMYNTLGLRKAYVIDDAETYGVGIADSFSKEWTSLGGTVLGRISEPSTTTSYLSLLTQIAAKHPDVIYFGGLDSTGGILIGQQMLQVPALQAIPLGGGDGIVTPTFASAIGVAGGPVYGTVAVVDTSTNPSAATFRQQYAAAFPSDPINVYSAAAYDSANILIQAIKTALANGAKAPTSSSDTAGARAFRQAVINAVQGISYDGVTGHQSFDQNGDTTNKVLTIYQLANLNGKPDWKFITAVTVQ